MKSRKAQSTEDFETWKESEVVGTLTPFDCGDVRTTVIRVEEKV